MQAVVGQEAPFDEGRQQMKLLAGLEVTTKAVERTAEAIGQDIAAREQQEIQRGVQLDRPVVMGEPIPILYIQMDGTGVPVVKKETVGRHGKTDGQPAHTREAKLAGFFTQTTWDEEGYPIRDPDSTTYTGAIETAEEFGKRIYLEAWKRGWSRAETKVVMGDGAEWIWNLAEPYFPGAVQIVDLYHARQHLWELARKLYPNHEVNQRVWIKAHQRRLLDKGKIEKLVAALRSIRATNPGVLEKIRIEADYFERSAERMRYPKFRKQHLFVGSGVIEAGCKTVIGSRLKQSGMFWTVRGANAIIPCAVAISTPGLKPIGRRAEWPDPHFYIAHPSSLLCDLRDPPERDAVASARPASPIASLTCPRSVPQPETNSAHADCCRRSDWSVACATTNKHPGDSQLNQPLSTRRQSRRHRWPLSIHPPTSPTSTLPRPPG
jgi:hypothetical protein